MQCRLLGVGHSAWPVRLHCGLILLALLSAGSVGAIASWWLQCGWLPVFYYCFAARQFAQPGWVLSFDSGLQIRSDAVDSADTTSEHQLSMQQGELLPDSQQCWLGFWLHWRSSDGQIKRRWLFQDALSAADVRTLARHIQQLRWQRPAAPVGFMQWFS
jgi:hypothetical protein